MNEVRQLQSKYKYNNDDLVPDEYVSEHIKDLSSEISNIDRIISRNKDNKELVTACENLKKTLNLRIECNQERLESIQKSLDEKDEDEH